MEAPRATGEPHHSQHHLEQTRVRGRAHLEMGLKVDKRFEFGKGRYIGLLFRLILEQTFIQSTWSG